MATTAIWDVTDRLDRVINYATNPNKTENLDFSSPDFQGLQNVLDYTQQDTKTEKQFYVTGINCDPATACEQMSRTKLQFQKTDGILAFHGYQSFVPGEATPETAHAIGVKLAQELWGERFEVIVSTHLDKHHLHNHFVLNSVSFMDGKRYYDNNATYALLRQTSDRLCREYSLHVIENPQKGKSRHYAEWKTEQEGKPTWRGLIREDVDKAISASMTFTQFIATLRKQGYEVKTGVKYMAVRPPGKERFVRLKTLGDDYNEEAIRQRILQNRAPKRPQALPEPKKKRYIIRGGASLKKVRKLAGLQALYFHYLYKMGILPKHRASNKRTHFLLREDIRHMEEITAQAKLLCKHRIENKEQLLTFRNSLEQEMTGLYDNRKSLYNRIRRCKDDEQITAYKEQIAELSKKLSLLRKEVKLCKGILSRSEEMKRKLLQINSIKERRKKYMNSGADAADQIVNMSLKGIEVMAKISGEGAKNLATYLYAVLKDQKKTRGKTRLEGLLRSGKELKVFAVRNEDLKKFTQEAKRYGVLYCALRDKKSLDGMCDIMVRAEDASKINRIVERFKLATVDTASIKSEIEKSKAARESQKEPTVKETPTEKSADDFLNELMAKPDQPEPVKEQHDNPNPTMATTEKSRPSEPISERSGKVAEGAIEPPKKSVRKELREIKADQKEQAEPKHEPAKEQLKTAAQNAKPNKQQSKSRKPKSKAR